MKKILKVFFKTFLILFGLIVLALVGGGFLSLKENKEGEIIADQWVPAIVSQWDINQLSAHQDSYMIIGIGNAQNSTLNVTNDNPIAKQVLDYGRTKLGKMTNYNKAYCHGFSSNVQCDSEVKFENGAAHILVTLREETDGYKLLTFTIVG